MTSNRIHDFFLMPYAKRKGITDSILLASGQEVLGGTVAGLHVSVVVVGDNLIRYKGKYYSNPDEYPDELVKCIQAQENLFVDTPKDDDFAIFQNNWYELRIDFRQHHIADSTTEIDLPKLTVREAREFILDEAAPYINAMSLRFKNLGRYDLRLWPDSQTCIRRRDCLLINPDSAHPKAFPANRYGNLDSAFMVPAAHGEYVRFTWPESQKFDEKYKHTLADYNGHLFVPVWLLL